MLTLKRIFTIKAFEIGYRSYTRLSYIHNTGTEPLKYLTFGNILAERANSCPDTEAVISLYQNKVYNYKKILEESDRVAAGLLKVGMNKGDRLGLWCPNMLEWVIVMAASARIGLVLVTMNTSYQRSEIEHCIKEVGIKAIVCPDKVHKFKFYDILGEVLPDLENSEPGKINCPNIPSLTTIITISDKSLGGTYNYNEILNYATDTTVKNIRNNQHEIQPDDIFNIQFTSGTTGKPKATCLTHFNIVNNAYFAGKRNELDKKQHKVCVQVPFFHAFGVTVTIVSAFHFGSTLVLPSSTYNSSKNLKAIESENCTIIVGTPTMYVDLINTQYQMKANINPEIALTGGSPCSPKIFKEMQSVLKVKRVKSVLGMTEGSGVAFQSLPISEKEYEMINTVGHIGEHLEAKVVDEKGYTVPFGTPGELWIRGYPTMLCYWNDEAKTSKVLTKDGWLKTGDQFILQEDGYGRIVGRLKEMIIRGGENIFPKEIEDYINTHPDILENYVIGLKHERLGEELCVCIRVKEGSKFTYTSLVEHCKGNIANFKIPTQMVLMNEFPKTVSGKIQKFVLQEKVEKLMNLSQN